MRHGAGSGSGSQGGWSTDDLEPHSQPAGGAVCPRRRCGTGGRIVAFPAPAAALDYAWQRGGRGDPTLFLKPLAAGPGDHVCVTDRLEINGRFIAPVMVSGPDGVPLPRWSGCRALATGEWLTYAPRIPNSLDGRYYGPVQASDMVGVFRPVWTWD